MHVTTNSKLITISTALILGVIFFTPAEKMSYRTTVVDSLKLQSANNQSISSPYFMDKTLESGVISQHTQGGKHLSGLNETLGTGACAFDYDNDGWIDILSLGGSGQTRYYGRSEWWQKDRGNTLYKNLGNGQFKNVTLESGISIKSWGMGCTSADFDNDGDQDVLLTNLGENHLLRNNGNGTFTNITKESGIKGNYWSTSASIADYDNDGLLDIYIVNYIDFQKGARTLEKASGFRSQTTPTFRPQLYNSQANKLYRNKGNLIFEDVTRTAGVENSGGRGLSATWHDFDKDLQPDLIVANDSGLPNTLFINNGNGTFSDTTAKYNLNNTKSTRGITLGDIDNDNDIDLFMSTDSSIPMITYVNSTSPANNFMLPGTNNSGYIFNNRNRDLGFANELMNSLETWGISLQDFNNDGWLDLLTVNGHVTPDPDNTRLPKGQEKQIWLNQYKGKFISCKDCGEGLKAALSARGVAIADYDNDGDIDVYTSHNNDMGQLLINELVDVNWINLHLQGTTSNKDAIGSRISITTAKGMQTRFVNGNPTFLSSGDKRIHFGLDDIKTIDEINILWPNGEKQSFSHVAANQFILIKQGDDSYNKLKYINKQQQSSSIVFKEPHHLIAAIGWLMNRETKQLAEKELTYIYKSKDTSIRQKVIQQAGLHHTPATLSILVDALKDNDITNRIIAIKNLQAFEDERTIRWLLHSFNDKHYKVRCAVANAFAFFFREEEAVINHKYLAAPKLIRMLSDKSSEARACAARALGDAELYRGSVPLTQLLKDKETKVRVEAARSLGLIREKAAIPYLLRVIENSKQPPMVKFHSLVALQRLQYPDIKNLINSTLNSATLNKDYNQIYNLAQALLRLVLDREDGVTIRSSLISDNILMWLEKTDFSTTNNKSFLKSQLVAIDILRKTKNQKAIRYVKKLLGSTSVNLRAHAYLYMIGINSKTAKKHIDAGLRDASLFVKKKVLSFIVKEKIKPSFKAIKSLQKNNALELLKIQSLRYQSDSNVAPYLVKYASSKSNNPEIRIIALNTLLTQHTKTLPRLPDSIYQDPNSDIRTASLHYWSSRNKSKSHIKSVPVHLKVALKDGNHNVWRAAINTLSLRKEHWASQSLYKYLFDLNKPEDLRVDILHKITENKSPRNISILLRLAKNKQDKLSIKALRALANYPTPEVTEYLLSIYNNPSEAEKYRFAAIQSLVSIKPKIALNKLIKITN